MAKIKTAARNLTLLSLLFGLSGCAEVRALFTVLFTKATSLSTSAFEFDEIRSGSKVTCTVLGDKSLRCLGSGDSGNLGTFNGGPVTQSEAPVKSVATGKGFTCYVGGATSKVFCFGKNDKGQLGNGSVGSSVKPVPVTDLENSSAPLSEVKEVSAGENHACALLKSGRVVCWGDNSFGQLGNIKAEGVGARSVLESEKNPKPYAGVKSIEAGANSTCMIVRDEGMVLCFGERFEAKLKLNWVPERVELANSIGTLTGAKQIGVGRGFGCALTKGSQVYCWGKNESNQLGLMKTSPGLAKATQVEVSYPQEMPLSKIEQITVGESHACALHREEKTVYCWGDNRTFQLGNASNRGLTEQVAIGSNNLTLKGVKQVSAGADRTCIISARDEIFCWGSGAHGILGNSKVSSIYPVAALDLNREPLSGAVQVQVGYDHTCLVDQREKLYCFGLNTHGQLGSSFLAGVAINGEDKPILKVTSIDVQGSKTCLVYGESQGVGCFGDHEIDNVNSKPKQNSFIIEDLRKNGQAFQGAGGVAIGKNEICVIEGNQMVTCLPRGEVKTNPVTVSDSSHVQLKDIWQLKIRGGTACALSQESGSIFCWGQDTLSQAESAQQVTLNGQPSKEFIQLAVTADQVCGVQGSERTLYCTASLDPTLKKIELIPAVTDTGKALKGVVSLSGGQRHLCAVNESGQLYCWGKNESSQFGTKSPLESTNPILIQLKNDHLGRVNRVAAGDHHTCVSSPDEASLYCFGESFYNGSNAVDPVEYPL